MPTTISRAATKKIAAIRSKTLTCRVFALRDDFTGRPCDPSTAWEALQAYRSARLTVNDAGAYIIRVHDNLWYELTPAPEPAPPARPARPDGRPLLFAIDADCPGCGKPERAFDPARGVFLCSSLGGGPCGYESTERES